MNRGFSLVELIVVLAVLAVLSSIASAKLQSMRDEAEAASCRTNLANLATAEQLYATQHGYINFSGSMSDLEPFITGGGGNSPACPSGGEYVLNFDRRGGVQCTWAERRAHGSVSDGIKSWE